MGRMKHSARLAFIFGALASLALAACAPNITARPTPTATHETVGDTPVVDPDYIYDQLFSLVTKNLRRESGYDTGLPSSQNGHDEFAAAWAGELERTLAGFGPVVTRDSFPITGWANRPAQTPATNIEVTVPGAEYPEQSVIVGCHYDGEAVSTQSAYDDASGCAITLGVAKGLADYWRAHRAHPARTLKFVAFDTEEQGLFGSFHYVNETINGELGQVVAMFNEEQSGIAYPLRFLGKAENPPLPLYIQTAPLTDNITYTGRDQLSQRQREGITRFGALMAQAVPAAFDRMRALGYTELAYHQGANETRQPIFTDVDLVHVQTMEDDLGGSDQIPFTLAGLPCATLSGDHSYYQPRPNSWGYPYDQPDDTIQLMNVYASGREAKSPALALALALPGMITAWMLHQPEVMGESPAPSLPMVAIADVGRVTPGRALTFAAHGYEPAGGALTYTWDFGDGGKGEGPTAQHTYASAGAYTLTLTARSERGTRIITQLVQARDAEPAFPNPYAGSHLTGAPRRNPAAVIPTPAP